MERKPAPPERLRPADPRLPAVRAEAPCNRSELHCSEAPIPALRAELTDGMT